VATTITHSSAGSPDSARDLDGESLATAPGFPRRTSRKAYPRSAMLAFVTTGEACAVDASG